MDKTIGIVGLGLIGGSFLKAIKARTKYNAYGYDCSLEVIDKASGLIEGELNKESMKLCDIIIICLYPKDAVKYVKENIEYMKKGTIILDCVGVKQNICDELSKFCHDNGSYFVGGHPMAGIEKSGFDFAYAHLYDGANMIFCKDEYTNIVAMTACEMLCKELGFSRISYATADQHDKVIAFTSQLAHVVSNAYIQSENANMQLGFSAGSYKDLTRVAYLNEGMWSELFIENKKALGQEVRDLAKRLEVYADLIEAGDQKGLMELLAKGKKMKERIG